MPNISSQPTISMHSIPSNRSASAVEPGSGLLFVEHDRALLTVSCPQADLNALLSSVKAFELSVERDGSAVLHALPVTAQGPMTIVLAAGCLDGANLLQPDTNPTRLTFVAVAVTGAKLIGEFLLRVHRGEVRFRASDLRAALSLLRPGIVVPSPLEGEAVRALYSFLPAEARYRVEDGEIVVECPPLTAAREKEIAQLTHWAQHANRTGNAAVAVRDLGRIVALDPASLKARKQYISSIALSGNFEGARAELHHLLLLSPDDSVAWRHLASLNLGRNPVQSQTYLQRAADLDTARNGSSSTPVEALAGFYGVSRQEVEAMDFTHFLSLYGRGSLPSGPRLASLMGAVTLSVSGYGDDPREIWEIPEVRRFFQALLKVWPYAPFFCDLGNWDMAAMYQCCLGSIVTRRVDGQSSTCVTYDPVELTQLVKQTMDACQELWSQAGLTTPSICERTKAVFEYFMRS